MDQHHVLQNLRAMDISGGIPIADKRGFQSSFFKQLVAHIVFNSCSWSAIEVTGTPTVVHQSYIFLPGRNMGIRLISMVLI